MIKGHYSLLLLILLLTVLSPVLSHAQNKAPPSEESFIQTWENLIKASDTTIAFEKTDEANIYNFKSKLFDYDGQLKLLNVFIKYDEGYSYTDKNFSPYYIGTAEVELLVENQDLEEKYPQSYNEWQNYQTLYYSIDQGEWMSLKEWYDLARQNTENLSYYSYYNDYVPLVFFILFLIFLARTSIAQRKRLKKQDEILQHHLENQNKQIALLEKIAKDVSK